jgi:beta-lactamase class A
MRAGSVMWLLWCAPLAAQPTAIDLLESKTLAEIRRFDEAFDGALGVAAIDLETGRPFAYHGDTQFTQASVIKIPIMLAMYRAGLATAETRQWIGPMIEVSDNAATNRCIDLLGMDRVNRMLADLGFAKTRLQRKMLDGAAARSNRENISTPNEMARLVETIYRGKAADRRACDEMLALMKKVRGGIAQGLPLDIETAVKTGEVPGARGETGIVFLPGRPFVLSVMSSFIDDRRTPVPEVTRVVYRFFEKLAGSNRYGNRLN